LLHVPSDGSPATLSANSTLGLLRGLTTFEQLWYDLDGAATYTLEAPITISDAPAFVCIIRCTASSLHPDYYTNIVSAISRIFVGHGQKLVSAA
jgi:hypothetical protein